MAWPFGPILRAGQSVKDNPNILVTELESGPVHKTLLSTDYTSELKGAVHLADEAALAAWRAFVNGEALLGAAWFDADIRTSGAVATHQVRLEDWGPSVPQGKGFRMPFTLEVREQL